MIFAGLFYDFIGGSHSEQGLSLFLQPALAIFHTVSERAGPDEGTKVPFYHCSSAGRTAVKIYCADEGFERIRENGIAFATAGYIVSARHPDVLGQAQPSEQQGQCRTVDKAGPLLLEFTLFGIGELVVENVRDDQTENRVAQELQPLVMCDARLAVFVPECCSACAAGESGQENSDL